MIELAEVRRTWRKGTTGIRALDGVSLSVEPGEFVALMGPSGSGKSTLMNVVGLLDRPDSGRYRFEGRDTGSLTPDQQARVRNERIGFVFQAFHLLPRATATENVELPLIYAERQGPADAGLRALERVGLADRASHLPHELSGGQQQRVAIARALVMEPALILADEPTGNLDSASAREIMELLRRLNQGGTTMMIVTHDLQVARYAERVIEIRDGRIVSDSRVAAPVFPEV
jgi:putative ABC transport system ATP-binding protein